MTSASPPHVGFVIERSLGHITHADNLRRLLPNHPEIVAELMEIPFDTNGWPARVPVFNSNWTVRAGVRAFREIARAQRRRPLQALFVHTQVPAVLATHWIKKLPSVVSLDATPLQYDELGEHYDHRRGNPMMERLKWRANRGCLRAARRIVTWSDWAKRGVVDGYEIEPDKITVVPPGVTPGLWANPHPRPVTDAPVRILFVGGDLERKGGDVLLRAFDRLRSERAARETGAGVELHVVTRSEVTTAPDVVVHHGLAPNSPELIALYHRSDVFCLPTRGDCLPMVLSEAGAAGLPLVSTAVAGIPEIVRHEETGLVVPPDDEHALAVALGRLVDDGALRRRLGDAARRLVDARFDADKNVATLVDMLIEVAASEMG